MWCLDETGRSSLNQRDQFMSQIYLLHPYHLSKQSTLTDKAQAKQTRPLAGPQEPGGGFAVVHHDHWERFGLLI